MASKLLVLGILFCLYFLRVRSIETTSQAEDDSNYSEWSAWTINNDGSKTHDRTCTNEDGIGCDGYDEETISSVQISKSSYSSGSSVQGAGGVVVSGTQSGSGSINQTGVIPAGAQVVGGYKINQSGSYQASGTIQNGVKVVNNAASSSQGSSQTFDGGNTRVTGSENSSSQVIDWAKNSNAVWNQLLNVKDTNQQVQIGALSGSSQFPAYSYNNLGNIFGNIGPPQTLSSSSAVQNSGGPFPFSQSSFIMNMVHATQTGSAGGLITSSSISSTSVKSSNSFSWSYSQSYNFGTNMQSSSDTDSFEFLEDWFSWGDWILQQDGTESRERVCKNLGKQNGLCRGSNKQMKKLVKVKDDDDIYEYPVDDGDDICEHLEDWEEWGGWYMEIDGYYHRKRQCKNLQPGGNCRGQSGERRRLKKTCEKNVVLKGEIDEYPEDWNLWGEWHLNSNNRWVRKRRCKNKNKNGPCRGLEYQRRPKGEGPAALDVPEDWNEWGDWYLNVKGIWIRKRTCKNTGPNKMCRGRNFDKKPNSNQTTDNSITLNPALDTDKYPDDWYSWGYWELDIKNRWIRRRLCKKQKKDTRLRKSLKNVCRGKNKQISKTKPIEVQNNANDAYPEDFTIWTKWEITINSLWIRKRTCINKATNGNCRGSEMDQAKVKPNLPGYDQLEEDTDVSFDSSSSSDSSDSSSSSSSDSSDSQDKVFDWDMWTIWNKKDGYWIRQRHCLKTVEQGGRCRGKSIQKSKKKPTDVIIWIIIYDSIDIIEDATNWFEWSEWTYDTFGVCYRTRQCKNINVGGPCIGKDKQTRITVGTESTDWEEWGQWYLEQGNYFVRTRKCKVAKTPTTCKGPNGQRVNKNPGNGTEPEDYEEMILNLYQTTAATAAAPGVNGAWGAWSNWSPLTGKENPETQTRTRNCDSPASSGIGLPCPGQSIDTFTFYTPIPGAWSDWGQWSAPQQNGTVTKRLRTCTNPAPKYGGAQCFGQETEIQNLIKPINGQWSQWSTWVSLLTLQNPETYVRRRYCDSPNPSNGGLPCVGSPDDTKYVNMPVNGVWGEWSPWVDQNEDVRQRVRNCDNPAPLYGGNYCSGPNTELQNIIKPTNGGWSEWGAWSAQTYLTNPENIIRSRFCNNPTPANGGLNCIGDSKNTQPIYTDVDGGWSTWSEWTPQIAIKKLMRIRKCENPAPLFKGKPCDGSDSEYTDMIFPTDGNWSPWQPWSTPLADSNPETVYRKRFCDSPTPANNGKDCEGPAQDTKEIYNPVDGAWTVWSPWSQPDRTDTQYRNRSCTNPAPLYNGNNCTGTSSDSKVVLKVVGGLWGLWSPWSIAPKKQNPEYVTRNRFCDSPAPKNGGNDCIGSPTDTKQITYPIPGNWSPWTIWTKPKQLAPSENITRTRTCTNPAPAYGGDDCIGSNMQLQLFYSPINGAWSVWNPWIVQTTELQRDTFVRWRNCTNPPPQYKGIDCSGLNSDVKVIIKAVDGQWGPWGVWTTPQFLVNPDTITRNRLCNNPAPINGGNDCTGSDTDSKLINKPINGAWTDWTQWTQPDIDKLPMNITRSRSCTNPAPMYNGLNCIGVPVDVKLIEKLDPVDGAWGDWTPWSKQTNLTNPEIISRTRSCNNPTPLFKGKDCIGLGIDTKNITRPVDGIWGPWTNFPDPTGNTNPETLTRTRKCENPAPLFGGQNCIGSDTDQKIITRPVDGLWCAWGTWSPLTGNTNPETTIRSRACNCPKPIYGGASCVGSATDQNVVEIPVDGKWSLWATWSKPKNTSPSETLTRTRLCNNPAPKFKGMPCPGNNTETQLYYNPVNGNWSPWTIWSKRVGKQEIETINRTRTCTSPKPNYNGLPCSGNDKESTQVQNEIVKPVNGLWSDWTDWSTPNLKTNPETLDRSRTCTNPSPQFGGLNCTGRNTDTKSITHPVDGVWSLWGKWSLPTKLSNPETIFRKRTCTNPSPAYGGKQCSGLDTDNMDIVTPINGNWGEWSPWSAPTVVGTTETITRTRVCDSPRPAFDGTDCQGNNTDINTYQQIPKPIDGAWGDWSPWSTPLLKENPETLFRGRQCNNPAPAFNGAPCQGINQDTTQFTSPIDGGWSPWSCWSLPVETGVFKIYNRQRTCSNPFPLYGGIMCNGSDQDTMKIKVEVPPPIDGGWSEWSDWSVNPDIANLLMRKRFCNQPEPKNGGVICEKHDEETKLIKVCPKGFTYLPNGNKCYRLVKSRLSWDNARSVCKLFDPNAHLLVINDQSEQTSLSNFFKSNNETIQKQCFDTFNKNVLIWNAAKRSACLPGSRFTWLPIDDKQPQEIIYSAWAKIVPNEKPISGSQCTYFKFPDFLWTDGPCGCENIPKPSIPPPDEDDINKDVPEVPEDWEEWGEWKMDSYGFWFKIRKCKNGSKDKCRGPCKIKTLDIADIDKPKEEVKEDWECWGQWSLDEYGFWFRVRRCKSMDPKKCRGRQMHRVRNLVDDTIEWSYEEDYNDKDDSDDWNQWGDWFEETIGLWSRKRTCKNWVRRNGRKIKKIHGNILKNSSGSKDKNKGSKLRGSKDEDSNDSSVASKDKKSSQKLKGNSAKKCNGKKLQRRRKKTNQPHKLLNEFNWSYDSDSRDKIEVPEDWNEWGEWVMDLFGVFTRTRTCKSSLGKQCRGRPRQQRIKSIKAKSVDVDEVKDDWLEWGDWNKGSDGFWIRIRICKNTNPKLCRGKSQQKRKTKPVDKVVANIDADWFEWSDWFKNTCGYYIRTRVCKKPISGPCRGRNKQKKSKKSLTFTVMHTITINVEHESSYSIDRGGIDEEDSSNWYSWSEWNVDDRNPLIFIRTRACRNGQGGRCIGTPIEKRKKRNWIINRDWSVEDINDGVKEVTTDWKEWGLWTDNYDGTQTRKRNCLTGVQCRGKSSHCRRLTAEFDPKTKLASNNWNKKKDQETDDDDDDDDENNYGGGNNLDTSGGIISIKTYGMSSSSNWGDGGSNMNDFMQKIIKQSNNQGSQDSRDDDEDRHNGGSFGGFKEARSGWGSFSITEWNKEQSSIKSNRQGGSRLSGKKFDFGEGSNDNQAGKMILNMLSGKGSSGNAKSSFSGIQNSGSNDQQVAGNSKFSFGKVLLSGMSGGIKSSYGGFKSSSSNDQQIGNLFGSVNKKVSLLKGRKRRDVDPDAEEKQIVQPYLSQSICPYDMCSICEFDMD